jgi:hypothetical protein
MSGDLAMTDTATCAECGHAEAAHHGTAADWCGRCIDPLAPHRYRAPADDPIPRRAGDDSGEHFLNTDYFATQEKYEHRQRYRHDGFTDCGICYQVWPCQTVLRAALAASEARERAYRDALQWALDEGGWRLTYYAALVPDVIDTSDSINPRLKDPPA